MRTPSVLEENDSRDHLWAVSEIFLRAGRNRSSVRHNSFLWSLAPLRFVLDVKGKIPTLTVVPSGGLQAPPSSVMSVRTSFGLGGRENEKSRREERLRCEAACKGCGTPRGRNLAMSMRVVQRSAGLRICLDSGGFLLVVVRTRNGIVRTVS